MKKQSIRKQVAVTTIVLLAVTILICLLSNILFLERIYTGEKKQGLIETYLLLNANADIEEMTSEEFLISLENACRKNNLNMIILSERNIPLLYVGMDLESLSRKLVQYRWGYISARETLEQTENYVIHTNVDSRTKNNNMEMWGQLDNGYTFLFTTPMESMEESAAISNRFLTIIGIISVIIGGITAWIYSGKISKPILKLADLSEKITHLDFEEKYSGSDKNEIGILGNNMNTLSESLEKTISELKTANMELQKDIQ